jgi:serine/threonine-protein kinase SBK
MDFGMTKRTGTWVKKVSDGIPYTPPEVSEAQKGARYCVDGGADVWALGVLLYCMLTGNFPLGAGPLLRPLLSRVSPLAPTEALGRPLPVATHHTPRMRLFRKVLEPRLDLRSKPADIFQYLDDSCLLATTSSSQRNKHHHQQQQQHLRDIEIDDVITGGRGGEEQGCSKGWG